jgi:hypothetical protein
MKLATIAALLAVGSCFGAGIATAATCNSTLGPITTTATVSGNSCGHNANFNSITYCNQVPTSSTGTDAWAIVLGANQSFTFTVTSPGTQGGTGFTPDIGLLSTACADNSPCITENTTGTGTVTAPASGNVTGNAAGTYYIIVTDSSGTGAGCGPYDLSFTGTLPVKLETFSVE